MEPEVGWILAMKIVPIAAVEVANPEVKHNSFDVFLFYIWLEVPC
jgi:hypothetical protein